MRCLTGKRARIVQCIFICNFNIGRRPFISICEHHRVEIKLSTLLAHLICSTIVESNSMSRASYVQCMGYNVYAISRQYGTVKCTRINSLRLSRRPKQNSTNIRPVIRLNMYYSQPTK